MNIAVFGWYHHQNAGDDRIQHCLSRWLDGHTLAFLPAGRPPPVAMLRGYDAAIIGGGGLLMRRGGVFRHMARWVRAAGIPVALVGVSVEQAEPALLGELRALLDLDRCLFAWFRDRGSLAAVGAHRKAFCAPDVTWLYPFPAADGDGAGIAVGLRPQRDLPLDGWRRALGALDQPLRPWPLYFEGGGDAAVLRRLLGERTPVADDFTLAPARRAAAIVTGRFHGLLFALQLGRPVLAVSSLPKVRRFLADNELPPFIVAEDRPQDLAAVWPAFVEHWPAAREQARRVRERLHQEVAARTEPYRALLLDAASRPKSALTRARLWLGRRVVW